MRDICQCESNGCQTKGSVRLDTRTIQKHWQKDQLRIFEKAMADSEHALEEQLDHISLHLSKSQLTDSPTTTTNDVCHQIANLSLSEFPLMDSPAQTSSTTNDLCQQFNDFRLSSSKFPITTHSPAQTSSTTNDLCQQLTNLSLNSGEVPSTNNHSSKIQDVLTRLSDVEATANALLHNTASLKNSTNMSHSSLDSLLLDCYRLQASLSKVTLKAAPVTAKKEDISEILSKVEVQLEALKSELVKKRKHEQQPAPVYHTGMAFR